nr:putative integron gene cassette protein [uncultured bacterium]
MSCSNTRLSQCMDIREVTLRLISNVRPQRTTGLAIFALKAVGFRIFLTTHRGVSRTVASGNISGYKSGANASSPKSETFAASLLHRFCNIDHLINSLAGRYRSRLFGSGQPSQARRHRQLPAVSCRLTIRSRGCHFVAPLNSGVRRQWMIRHAISV